MLIIFNVLVLIYYIMILARLSIFQNNSKLVDDPCAILRKIKPRSDKWYNINMFVWFVKIFFFMYVPKTVEREAESTIGVCLLHFNNEYLKIRSKKGFNLKKVKVLFSSSCSRFWLLYISKNVFVRRVSIRHDCPSWCFWLAHPLETLADGEFLFRFNVVFNEIDYFNAKRLSDIRSRSNNASFGVLIIE